MLNIVIISLVAGLKCIIFDKNLIIYYLKNHG